MFVERSGIYLENLKREKSTIIKASVPVKEFKNVVKIAKECKCKIKIKSKKGIPFILNRYRAYFQTGSNLWRVFIVIIF